MFRQRGQIWARICVLAGALAWIGGCNSNDGVNPVIEGDSDEGEDPPVDWIDPYPPPAPWNELTWTESIVEVGGQDLKAGYQSDLVAASDGTLYYVYWKFQGDGGSCGIAAFNPGDWAPNLQYFLKVAVKAPGDTDWTVETVPLGNASGSIAPDDPPPNDGPLGYAVTLFGIDAEIDPSDNLVIAVAAGGTALYTCGSAELVLATRTPAGAYNIEAVVNSSGDFDDMRGGDPMPLDVGLECCDDPNCGAGAGDTSGDVGAWAGLAIRSNGTRSVAYSDQHNFGVLDGQTNAGLEYWGDDLGAPRGIRPYSGWGQYADLIWASTRPIVAYTGYGRSGLRVLYRNSTANDCATDPTDNKWLEASFGTSSFSQYKIGERIRFAEAPDGTIGMVFHAQKNNSGEVVDDLYLCETGDQGANWGCTSIDTRDLHVGGYPSLAYDNDSNPMVAYHYCGSAECPASSDGLRVAIRLPSSSGGDRWYRFNVHSVRTSRSGFYTGLAFNPVTNEPTVVFQDLTHGAAVAYHGHLP